MLICHKPAPVTAFLPLLSVTSSQLKLFWSFFEVVHTLFHCPFNVGHLIVLCCIYASDCSQQHAQDGRGA